MNPKTTRLVRHYLLAACGLLLVAGALLTKPILDTRDDLERERRLTDDDFARARALLTDLNSPDAFNVWIDCDRAGREARDVMNAMNTQIGVVYATALLNMAIADGCDLSRFGLTAPAILERFDTTAFAFRWQRFAELTLGFDAAVIRASLRDTLTTQIQNAECSRSVIAPIRAAGETPDRNHTSTLTRDCWSLDEDDRG